MSTTQGEKAPRELPMLVQTLRTFEQLRPEEGASLREWFDYHSDCAEILFILARAQADPGDFYEVIKHAGQAAIKARGFKLRIAAATE